MPKNSKKLQEFEGLRGVAAMMVVFSHLINTFTPKLHAQIGLPLNDHLPAPLATVTQQIIACFHDGDFAVWVFWVMSGFVLSLSWFASLANHDPQKGHRYLVAATVRRYPRLLIPVAASVALAFILAELGLMRNQELAARFGEQFTWLAKFYNFDPSVASAVKGATWDTFFAYEEATTYNAVLWTMEKELWGSFFVFSFLFLFRPSRARLVGYAVVGFALLYLRLHWLNSFLVGVILSDYYIWRESWPASSPLSRWLKKFNRIVAHVPVLGAISLGFIILVGGPNYYQITHLLLAGVACFLVLEQSRIRNFFRLPFAAYLGKISFGLYLVHLPIICSFTCALYLHLIDHVSHALLVPVCWLATIALSLAAGHGLYVVADGPSIPISKSFASLLTKLTNQLLRPRVAPVDPQGP